MIDIEAFDNDAFGPKCPKDEKWGHAPALLMVDIYPVQSAEGAAYTCEVEGNDRSQHLDVLYCVPGSGLTPADAVQSWRRNNAALRDVLRLYAVLEHFDVRIDEERSDGRRRTIWISAPSVARMVAHQGGI